MKLVKFVGLLSVAAPLALGLSACTDDPTDEGAGDAFAIVTSVSTAAQSVGGRFTVTAQVVDRMGTPLPIQITASSVEADVVAVDSTIFVPEIQETRFFLRTLKVDAGAAVILSAGALTDTVNVTVLTGPFPGTVDVANFSGGRVLQFTSPTALFDANTAVVITTAEPGYLIDQTATRIRYLLPFNQPAGAIPYSITGAGPADFSLAGSHNLATGVPCADTFEPNNTVATATQNALTVGTPLYGSGNLTSDPRDYYRFTVTEAGSYRVELDWTDATDVDVYPANAAGGLLSTAGGTAAKPERATVTLQPGTYNVIVDMYDDAGGACTTYKLTVTKV